MCNDLMVSLELEKECMQGGVGGEDGEVLGKIAKLKQLLNHMNQDYTRGEAFASYHLTYKQVLAGVLDM